MAYSEFCKNKMVEYRIKGKTKPFIDQNLQIQLPGHENPPNPSLYNPLYTHYQPANLSAKKTELNQAMEKTKHSFQAWKKLKEQLNKKALHHLKN